MLCSIWTPSQLPHPQVPLRICSQQTRFFFVLELRQICRCTGLFLFYFQCSSKSVNTKNRKSARLEYLFSRDLEKTCGENSKLIKHFTVPVNSLKYCAFYFIFFDEVFLILGLLISFFSLNSK